MSASVTSRVFPVTWYDLEATLTSGQAFRWQKQDGHWNGVVRDRWVQLSADEFSITAQTAEPIADWSWLTDYLQLEVDLSSILLTFPDDEPMRKAINACRGLRLLRQNPWECLASFILSSTKQIIQIRQIIALLCERFGEPIPAPSGIGPVYSFPSANRLARITEDELRACKMGFRAPYLLGAARAIANRELDLDRLHQLPVDAARSELTELHGVGRKIADCVLLFAYGFQSAFPVDVWVAKALRQLYFPRRRVNVQRIHRFAASHFGPNAGYAQQYLFHYMRLFSHVARHVPRSPRRSKAKAVSRPRSVRRSVPHSGALSAPQLQLSTHNSQLF